MARTGAERQAAHLQRLRDAAAEADDLRAEVERLAAELENVPLRSPRCDHCGTELACPRCYREENW